MKLNVSLQTMDITQHDALSAEPLIKLVTMLGLPLEWNHQITCVYKIFVTTGWAMGLDFEPVASPMRDIWSVLRK